MTRSRAQVVRRRARRTHHRRRDRDGPRGDCSAAGGIRNSLAGDAWRAAESASSSAVRASAPAMTSSPPPRRRSAPVKSRIPARMRAGAGGACAAPAESGKSRRRPHGDRRRTPRRARRAHRRRRRREFAGGGPTAAAGDASSRADGALQSAGASRPRRRARFGWRRFSRLEAAACHARAALRRGWHARRIYLCPADRSRGLGRWATG